MKYSHMFMGAIIYVLLHQTDGTTAKATYSGMDPSVVSSLLKERQSNTPGLTYDIVSQKEFDAIPDKARPFPSADPVREQAILDAKNSGKSPQERLDALIKVIDLK